MREGDHAGTKSYTTSYTGDDLGQGHHQDCSDSDNSFSLPPVAIPGGWDESDEWEDEEPEWPEGGNENDLGRCVIPGEDDVSVSSIDGIDEELGTETQNASGKNPPPQDLWWPWSLWPP